MSHVPTTNVRKLATYARHLGATVENKRRTGEWRWSHPAAGRVVTQCSTRRKDATRALLAWFKRLQETTISPQHERGTP